MCGSNTPFGPSGQALSVACALDFWFGRFPSLERNQTRRVDSQVISGQTRLNTKLFGGLTKSLISCPQKSGRIDKDGGY
jgi:hypothetical protein